MTPARRGRQYPDGPLEAPPSRMPDGRWSCVRDGVTEPCGDCDGCRYVQAQNLARIPASLLDGWPGNSLDFWPEAAGAFLASLFGDSEPQPGPPYTHTIAPSPAVYTRSGKVLYRPPVRPFTLTEGAPGTAPAGS